MQNLSKFNFSAISDACVKCGKCKPTCTIFDISGDEALSPRGFLDLIGAYKNGELSLDKNAKRIFESCFLCTNCVDVCPSSLATDEMIENVRFDLAQKYGITWYKKVFFYLLRHRKVMDFVAKMGYVFQSCGFKLENALPNLENEAKNSNLLNTNFKLNNKNPNMRPRFSLPMIKKERLLPSASKKSFLNSHSEFIDNGSNRSVGIFIGCMANYAYTAIGDGLLKILKKLNINAHLMKEQACCGAPAYFTGDFATTKYNAKKNIEYFEKILQSCEAIIIAEGTCSAMIKVDYVRLFEDDEFWQNRAKNVVKKIYLASEYFVKFTDLASILEKNKSLLSITYHDPCHARKMQGVFKEPRVLLNAAFKVVETGDNVSCCGFGGVTMQSQNYHLSKQVGLKRANTLINTGANIVSTECSACKMQLNNSLNVANSKLRCQNWVELVAELL